MQRRQPNGFLFLPPIHEGYIFVFISLHRMKSKFKWREQSTAKHIKYILNMKIACTRRMPLFLFLCECLLGWVCLCLCTRRSGMAPKTKSMETAKERISIHNGSEPWNRRITFGNGYTVQQTINGRIFTFLWCTDLHRITYKKKEETNTVPHMHIYWWFSFRLNDNKIYENVPFKSVCKVERYLCWCWVETSYRESKRRHLLRRDACRCSITLEAQHTSRVTIYNSLHSFPLSSMSFLLCEELLPKEYEHKMCACVCAVASIKILPISSMFHIIAKERRRRATRLDFYHLMIRCKFCYGRIIFDTLSTIKFNEQWQIWSSVNWLIMDACLVWISFVVSMFPYTSTAWACVNGAKINSLSSVIVWCGERWNKINNASVQNQYLLIQWNMKKSEYLRFYRLETTWATKVNASTFDHRPNLTHYTESFLFSHLIHCAFIYQSQMQIDRINCRNLR